MKCCDNWDTTVPSSANRDFAQRLPLRPAEARRRYRRRATRGRAQRMRPTCTQGCEIARNVGCAGSWSDHFAAWQPPVRSPTLLLPYEDVIRHDYRLIERVGASVAARPRAATVPTFDDLHSCYTPFPALGFWATLFAAATRRCASMLVAQLRKGATKYRNISVRSVATSIFKGK